MRRILVVDDDRAFADNLAELLQEEGFQTHACYSAMEGLLHVSQAAPDLVITDVRMAGMDGLGMLAELRRTHPEVQSVVITGYADESAGSRAIGVGVQDYLSKPFTLEQLRHTLRWVVERARTHQVVLTPPTPAPAEELATLAELREHAVRAFYVGVRSGAINSSNGYPLWVALEELDRLAAEPHPLDRKQAMEGYASLRTWIQRLAAPPPTRVRQAWFEDFCHLVREGSLDAREFSLAPILRRERRGDWGELHERLSRLG